LLEKIIAEIDAEIAQLQSVRALLSDPTPTAVKRGPGRPPRTPTTVVATPKKTKRRTLSPEARERIRQGQLKRWAAAKKAAKKSAK
jgi:hypothetical protein